MNTPAHKTLRRQDVTFEEKDQALRDDVRTLGAMVGELDAGPCLLGASLGPRASSDEAPRDQREDLQPPLKLFVEEFRVRGRPGSACLRAAPSQSIQQAHLITARFRANC